MEAGARLAALLARPPTPPRHIDSDKDGRFVHDRPSKPSRDHQLLDTSRGSSPCSVDRSSSPSDKFHKKVGFDLNLDSFENLAPHMPRSGSPGQGQAPSKGCKPTKSILKPSNLAFSSDPVESDCSNMAEARDFPRMLEDSVRELASPSASARFDAYLAINGCLKTYRSLPYPKDLVDKTPLLADFIRRDLLKVRSQDDVRNMQLATEVTRLATTLSWSQVTSDILPDSFQAFLMNESIATIADSGKPKTIISQYLYLLSVQRFRTKVLANDRINRLINSLQIVGDRFKSRQVFAQRLVIYRRLITQASAMMIARVEGWIEHLFHGMSSNIKEIRTKAMDLGYEASRAFGAERQVSRAVRTIMDSPYPSERPSERYSDFFIGRLSAWSSSSMEEAQHVPQIWSIVLLLLRSKPRQFEQWEHATKWLQLLRKCLISSHGQLRAQAFRAWRNFIFTVSPDINTPDSMVRVLRDPIIGQIGRCRPLKKEGKTEEHAHAAYHTLLYYAFRPGLDSRATERFWHEYVETLVLPRTGEALLNPQFVSQILVSLLGGGKQKMWDQNRIFEGLIYAEEIPRVDVKFIRQRSGTILKSLETLLMADEWWSLDDHDAPVIRVWRSFTKTLADAAQKEIKVSTESMMAMAELLSTLKSLFIRFSVDTSGIDCPTFLRRLSSLIREAAANIGPIPFTEKRLIQNSTNSFQATDTPSSRARKVAQPLSSPILHLFGLLCSSKHVGGTEEAYQDIFEVFVDIAIPKTASRRSKLKILREICQEIAGDQVAEMASKALWKILSLSVAQSIPEGKVGDGANQDAQHSGHDFREAIGIMEIGTHQTGEQSVQSWTEALDTILQQVRSEAGPGGCASCVLEPLASYLQHRMETVWNADLIDYSAVVLRRVSWPESRKDMEQSQRALWGSTTSGSKSSVFYPFHHINILVNDMLRKAYHCIGELRPGSIVHVLRALERVVANCPNMFLELLLSEIQRALGPWIEDTDGQLAVNDLGLREIFKATVELWTSVLQRIQEHEKLDSNLLSAWAGLLKSAFSSRHKAIINISICTWNSTFGQVATLEYPEQLHKVLFRLSLVTEVSLPGIDIRGSDSEADANPLEPVDASEGLELVEPSKESEVSKIMAGAPQSIDKAQKSQSLRSSELIRTPERDGKTPQRQITQACSKPRLHHDDSQVHFAPIEPSPTGSNGVDSQLLTDRQKEVKERQSKETTALFSDIRASPKPKKKGSELSELEVLANDVLKLPATFGSTSSPILPSAELAWCPESSPTPSQQRSSSREKSSHRALNCERLSTNETLIPTANDPHSSPPMIPTRRSVFELPVDESPERRPSRNSLRTKLADGRKSSPKKTRTSPTVLTCKSGAVASDDQLQPSDSAVFYDDVFSNISDENFADASMDLGEPVPHVAKAPMVARQSSDGSPHELEQARSFERNLLHPELTPPSTPPKDVEVAEPLPTTINSDGAIVDEDDPVATQIALEMEQAVSQTTQSLSDWMSEEQNAETTLAEAKIRCEREQKKQVSRKGKQTGPSRQKRQESNDKIFDSSTVSSKLKPKDQQQYEEKEQSSGVSPRKPSRKRSSINEQPAINVPGEDSGRSAKKARLGNATPAASTNNKQPEQAPGKNSKSSHIKPSQITWSEAASAATKPSGPDTGSSEMIVEDEGAASLGSSQSRADEANAVVRPGPMSVDAGPRPTGQAKEDRIAAEQLPPAALMAALQGGQDGNQTLVAQLQCLVAQAKGGVEAGERRALMLAAMELMKVAMDECRKSDL